MTSGVPVHVDFDDLFERIANSRHSLSSICKEMGLNITTVLRQINVSPELQMQETRARQRQADYIVRSIFDEIDQCYKIVMSPDYDNVTKHSYVNTCKLTIDSFKWIAAKFRPDIYGDRVAVDHNLEQIQAKFKSMFTEGRISPGKPKELKDAKPGASAVILPVTQEQRIEYPLASDTAQGSQADGMEYRNNNDVISTGNSACTMGAGQAGRQEGKGSQRAPRKQAKKRGGW